MNPLTSQKLSVVLEIWRFWNVVKNDESVNAPKCVCFSMEIQQFWNLDEIMDSMNVAKIEYNLGNMKNCENQLSTRKKRHSKKAYETCRFWTKIDADAPRQKKELSKSLWNLSFLNDFDDTEAQKEVTHYEILSVAAATARLWGPRNGWPKWRTKQFWAWLQPQHDFEVQVMKEESRFWTVLQFGWKVPTSSLEGKVGAPQWITD